MSESSKVNLAQDVFDLGCAINRQYAANLIAERNLAYVESFSEWLDATNDALLPMSFHEWLEQNDDTISIQPKEHNAITRD